MAQISTVDEYVESKPDWQPVLEKLRKVLNATRLEETVKWGMPGYVVNGKNVVGLGAFKEFVGLWFHQGALLSDPDKVLQNAQQGKTKAMRQWRFFQISDIKVAQVKKYLNESIKLAEEGREIKPQRKKPLVIPRELKEALAEVPKAKSAFAKLGTTKKREFAEYVADAKRDTTKQNRLRKILPMIEKGIGLHDKYRK